MKSKQPILNLALDSLPQISNQLQQQFNSKIIQISKSKPFKPKRPEHTKARARTNLQNMALQLNSQNTIYMNNELPALQFEQPKTINQKPTTKRNKFAKPTTIQTQINNINDIIEELENNFKDQKDEEVTYLLDQSPPQSPPRRPRQEIQFPFKSTIDKLNTDKYYALQ